MATLRVNHQTHAPGAALVTITQNYILQDATIAQNLYTILIKYDGSLYMEERKIPCVVLIVTKGLNNS